MQCKFPKYSCNGRTLENATVFPDRGFDGPNQAISTVYARPTEATKRKPPWPNLKSPESASPAKLPQQQIDGLFHPLRTCNNPPTTNKPRLAPPAHSPPQRTGRKLYRDVSPPDNLSDDTSDSRLQRSRSTVRAPDRCFQRVGR